MKRKITVQEAFETVTILFKDLQRENDLLRRRLNDVFTVIKEHKAMYPADVFPEDSDSQDAMSAKMARHTCDTIKKSIEERGVPGIEA